MRGGRAGHAFQELMPDPLHWLGVTKIDRFVSMSNMKYDALVEAGIKVKERVSIPEDMILPTLPWKWKPKKRRVITPLPNPKRKKISNMSKDANLTNTATQLKPMWSAPVQYLLSPEAVRERSNSFGHRHNKTV